jgi:hypothetical protein
MRRRMAGETRAAAAAAAAAAARIGGGKSGPCGPSALIAPD